MEEKKHKMQVQVHNDRYFIAFQLSNILDDSDRNLLLKL